MQTIETFWQSMIRKLRTQFSLLLFLLISHFATAQIQTAGLGLDNVYLPLLKTYLKKDYENIDLTTVFFYTNGLDATEYFIYQKGNLKNSKVAEKQVFVTRFDKHRNFVQTRKLNDFSIFELIKNRQFFKKVVAKREEITTHVWLNPLEMLEKYAIIHNGFVYHLEYAPFLTSPVIANERQLKQMIDDIIKASKAIEPFDKCQTGKDSAESDYSKGILRFYVFGQSNTHTFGKLLDSEYGIEAVYTGSCIIDEQYKCYSEFMCQKIKMKYGEDLFENIRKKARLLDSTGQGDRPPAFPGGETAFMKFIYCNIDLASANYAETRKSKVFVQVTIDTTGKPINPKIMRSQNEDYSKEALRIISLMPNWTTATQNGKAINQLWNLPIVFDQKWKEKECH